jgi:hypothetical protein
MIQSTRFKILFSIKSKIRGSHGGENLSFGNSTLNMGASIAQCYSDVLGLDSWGSIPARGTVFYLVYRVQTGSGIHPVSSPVVTGTPSTGIKRQGREADHSPPSSTEIKNGGAVPTLSKTPLWRGA